MISKLVIFFSVSKKNRKRRTSWYGRLKWGLKMYNHSYGKSTPEANQHKWWYIYIYIIKYFDGANYLMREEGPTAIF